MIKKIFTSFAIIVLLGLNGCYYDQLEVEPPKTDVSYANDIQPIFDRSCISCHPAVVAAPDLTEANSYESITNGVYITPGNTDTSLLYQRLLGNPSIMPPSGSLPTYEINLIETWILNGAPNN